MSELEVEFTVRRGSFVLQASFSAVAGLTWVSGRSGAGKSTLLEALAGLVSAEGAVRVAGETWSRLPAHRRAVGYVFQSLALFPHRTARQNAAFGADLQTADVWLTRMEVAHLSSRFPAQLSGGEAQRVALARAFARRPKLLLLDEPFAALDDALTEQLLSVVGREANVPCLIASHTSLGADVPRLHVSDGVVRRSE